MTDKRPSFVSDRDWEWYCLNEKGVSMSQMAQEDGLSAKYVRERVAKVRQKVTIHTLRCENRRLQERVELLEALHTASRQAYKETMIELAELKYKLNGPRR